MCGEGESESEAGGKNIGVMVGAERSLGEGGEKSEERRGGGSTTTTAAAAGARTVVCRLGAVFPVNRVTLPLRVTLVLPLPVTSPPPPLPNCRVC